MEHVKELGRSMLRCKLVCCALVFLAVVGPGIVKLSAMLQALQH